MNTTDTMTMIDAENARTRADIQAMMKEDAEQYDLWRASVEEANEEARWLELEAIELAA